MSDSVNKFHGVRYLFIALKYRVSVSFSGWVASLFVCFRSVLAYVLSWDGSRMSDEWTGLGLGREVIMEPG